MVHASNPKVGSPIEGLPTLPKEQVRVPVNPVLRLTTNLARLYKLCLLKQEQLKEGVYYSSCIKLIVSIFLVYKVKKCLVKSGKVNQAVGTQGPSRGLWLNKSWAPIAHLSGNECPNIIHRLGQYFLFLVVLT